MTITIDKNQLRLALQNTIINGDAYLDTVWNELNNIVYHPQSLHSRSALPIQHSRSQPRPLTPHSWSQPRLLSPPHSSHIQHSQSQPRPLTPHSWSQPRLLSPPASVQPQQLTHHQSIQQQVPLHTPIPQQLPQQPLPVQYRHKTLKIRTVCGHDLTVKQLKALAKKRGIKGYSTMTKKELIKVLKDGRRRRRC